VVRIAPDYGMAYYAAYVTLSDAGQQEQATRWLERWVENNPGDAQGRQLLEQQRRAMGQPPSVSQRPPVLQLP